MKSIFFGVMTALLLTIAGAGCTENDNWDTAENNDWQEPREDSRSEREERTSRRDNNDRNGTDDNEDLNDLGTELGDAFTELGNALEELGAAFENETSVEPVDYQDLRDVLPERIRGMEKGRSEGERSGALGFRISQVEQEYRATSGDARLDISIVDLGGLKNIAAFGLDWLKMDVERESNEGYERTRTYRGHPVLDKCEQRGRGDYSCEMVAYVSRRFVVALKSTGLDKGSLEGIMEQVDVAKLEEMREEGVQ